MAKNILIKPIITEKSEILSSEKGKYTFVVAKNANKIEIAKAVKEMFPEVTVKAVNTINMPAKTKNRNTRSGLLKGRISGFKKAIVTVGEGEEIDFFGEL